MNLTDMRAIVRRDLHDEDANNYRWTNDEIDRHIAHAVKDYSAAMPREQKTTVTTTSGSREISISSLVERVMVEAVEYPTGKFPPCFQRFAIWDDTVTLLGNEVPDGSNAVIYYGKHHTLDVSGATIAVRDEDLIASGAAGYAALESSVFAINSVNVGGNLTSEELLKWGRDKLDFFRAELKRLGRKNHVRIRSLYRPETPIVNKAADYGP